MTTTVTENVKTCGASFYDAAMEMDAEMLKPECAYDINTETNYEDAYWQYEPLSLMDFDWYGETILWT